MEWNAPPCTAADNSASACGHKKPYSKPQLKDLDRIPDTEGKVTNAGETTTFGGSHIGTVIS